MRCMQLDALQPETRRPPRGLHERIAYLHQACAIQRMRRVLAVDVRQRRRRQRTPGAGLAERPRMRKLNRDRHGR